MKINKPHIFSFFLLTFLLNNQLIHGQTVFTIHSDQVLHSVDEKIYGQFLEHIYNSVNNGLWGDLIWNRSFERLSGTSGLWSREGNEIVQSSLNENVRLLFGSTGWQNYEFTLQAKKESGSEGFLILFRSNGENFYWCNLGGWGNTLHAVEKGTPGARWNVFGNQINGSVETDKWYDIRIRCENNHFQIFLDGIELFNFWDNTATAHYSGQAGVGTWMTRARFRNFIITDLNGDTLYKELPSLEVNNLNFLNWEKTGTVEISAGNQALNSNYCIKLINKHPLETGIRQHGLNLKNQTYRGSLWSKGTASGNINIQLSQDTVVLAEQELPAPGVDWEEFPFQLTPNIETTNGTFRITFKDTGSVYLDQVSMMGQDAIDNDGFRPDLFEALEALMPQCIRWPGGYYSELYRWKDGIGPQHERGVFPVEAWNDLDVNSFGTDEFIMLCRKLNSEPIIVINTGHRYSAAPQAEFIEEAQHWLEYCNGTIKSTWGAVRAANGRPEPYNVKYWEIGNEIFLTRSAAEYINFLKAFVPALKAVDSSITIIACGSGGFDQNWNKTVINECADLIDYISPHHYENISGFQTGIINYENFTQELENIINASSNPDIKIYMSEWNVWSGLDWRNGLYAGGMLTMFERHGEYMKIAAPALFLRHTNAGDWNNALINFNNSDWFPAPNYVVMKFWRDHYAPNFLAASGNHNSLNVSTVRTDDDQEIYFKAVNASTTDVPVELEIDGSFNLRAAVLDQIAPRTLSASNTMLNPGNIYVERGIAEMNNGKVLFTVPEYAAVIVTLSQNPAAGNHTRNNNGIKDYYLYQNYPNPFNPSTTIRYELPKKEQVTLRIVDILGREIMVLMNNEQKSGRYQLDWSGTDKNGLPVSSGIYFYELVTASRTITKKMLLLR